MQTHLRQLVFRETLILFQYFVVSSLSAMWAHDYYLSNRINPPEVGVDSLHWNWLFYDLWHEYFIPWLSAFLLLCTIRFLILLFIYYFRQAHGKLVNK